MRQTYVTDTNNKEKSKKSKQLLCAKKPQKKKKKKMLYSNYNDGKWELQVPPAFVCKVGNL